MATAQSSSDQQEEDELFNLGEDRTPSCVQFPAHRSSSHLIVRQTILDNDAHNHGDELAVQRGSGLGQYVHGDELAVQRGSGLGQYVQANITAPVNFGDQKIRNKTTVYKQRVGDVGQQEVHHVERQAIAHVERQEIHNVTYVTHSSADHADNANENECWSQFNAEELPRIQEVNPGDVSRAVELLDQNRRVALCGPPGSGKSSLGHAILTHYHHRGFNAYLVSKLCCQCQQSFCKKKQSVILLDGGLGVVRLDNDQYYWCQDLITNTQCLFVITVYPHLLRDMAVLKTRRPLLPSSLIIDMKPRPHDRNNLFTPSVSDYLQLFRHMLHDPNFGRPMAALLALSMLGSYSLESDPPELTSDLQRLGLHGVDHYHLKQLAYNFRGSILPETGPGFASRLVYDAAGLALGSLHSRSVLLKVCDVTFLVQHVMTSRESHDCVMLIGRDRSFLMQRMHDLIVDGQMAALCQHPSLLCPEFLKDFEDFLTSHKNYMQQVVSAVDREHGLPLLYWSVWSPSPHLTLWCLTVTLQQVRESQVLPLHFVSAVVAVWFTETNIDTRLKAKQLIMKLKTLEKIVTVLELPFPSILLTQGKNAKVSGVKTRLQTYDMCYIDYASLPIPATLLSVTVTEDAVSVELPSQHWYLALRLLADREVDETDRDGNTLLHIAADKGNLEAISLAVKSGASLTKTNNKGRTPYQLAQRRRKKSNKATDRGNVVHSLFPAIRGGNDVTVKTLLCYGSSVHDKYAEGRTGLLVACKAGQGNIADLLINLGADVNVSVTSRWWGPHTPLFFACDTGLIRTVELLLKHNAVIDEIARWNQTALHWACQCKSPTASADITRLLLDAGADVNAQDMWGMTPLHFAACRGNTETLRRLIHHEADLNATDDEGRTPLRCAYTASKPGIITQLVEAGAEIGRVHQAVVRGDVDALVTLLQQGADVNQHDTSMGCSPLHTACLLGRTDIVTWLTQHGAKVNAVDVRKKTPLHIACQTGVADIVTWLTQHGAKVNAVNDLKRTPLHCACAAVQPHVARQLIDEGAEVNARDKSQSTPLHGAADKGNIEIVVCLLEHGAQVDATANYNKTPLHTASRNGHTETAQCLLQHGAKVNAVSNWYGTPLHIASEKAHTETAQCLLQHKADVNAVSERYGTPLHRACENGHTETAQYLLQHGANVNAVSEWNETPLHTACENGHTQTAQYLLQHGANVNAVSERDGTPLDVARKNPHHCDDLVTLLVQHGAVSSRHQVTRTKRIGRHMSALFGFR
ncbi:uncharacterized protein [Littorina saxatilis]|uniref:uncharacterized protein n=1 Tax=Littorina saxatilis TaxID=31220 RepID=UPI0038B5F5F0